MLNKIFVQVFLGLFLVTSGATAASLHQNLATKSAATIHQKAIDLVEDKQYLTAREYYAFLLNNHSQYNNISQVQQELNDLNIKMMYKELPDPIVKHVVVAPGDSLGKIAQRYHTTVDVIKALNGLKKNTIYKGQKLLVYQQPLNIEIDKSQNVLYLKSKNGVMKVYKVSTGEHNKTPVGEFEITTKLTDPVWYKEDGVVIAAGVPENGLGSRWLGFDKPSYGIHGTNDPKSIGHQLSSGCIRMHNQDVEELFKIVPQGTKVRIVN